MCSLSPVDILYLPVAVVLLSPPRKPWEPPASCSGLLSLLPPSRASVWLAEGAVSGAIPHAGRFRPAPDFLSFI